MIKLAALPNCRGWLSVDSENFEQAILAKCNIESSIWNFAMLQDPEMHDEVLSSLKIVETSAKIINFPYHRGGRHVQPLRDSILINCPAVVGGLNLQSSKDVVRPCQSCSMCLP